MPLINSPFEITVIMNLLKGRIKNYMIDFDYKGRHITNGLIDPEELERLEGDLKFDNEMDSQVLELHGLVMEFINWNHSWCNFRILWWCFRNTHNAPYRYYVWISNTSIFDRHNGCV